MGKKIPVLGLEALLSVDLILYLLASWGTDLSCGIPVQPARNTHNPTSIAATGKKLQTRQVSRPARENTQAVEKLIRKFC